MNNRLREDIKTSSFENIDKLKNENLDALTHFRDFLYNYDKSIFLPKNINDYVDDETLIKDVAFSIFALFDLDYENTRDKKFFYDYLLPSLHVLKKEDFCNDIYAKNIHFEGKSLQKWSFRKDFYSPLEAFVCDNSQFINGKEIPQIGLFKENYNYLSCYQNNLLWMSITPNEINTMKEPIKHAHGRCLVLGLGLGYYQYMISLKREVESIDVVELDKEAIRLFEELILPQYSCKDKISIINDDAYHYLRSVDLGKYDYIFIDLWHDTLDGLKWYKRLVPIEKKNIQYDYWIESGILNLLRNIIITILENYDRDFVDSLYNDIKKKIDKCNMSLDELLTYDGMKELLR